MQILMHTDVCALLKAHTCESMSTHTHTHTHAHTLTSVVFSGVCAVGSALGGPVRFLLQRVVALGFSLLHSQFLCVLMCMCVCVCVEVLVT